MYVNLDHKNEHPRLQPIGDFLKDDNIQKMDALQKSAKTIE